MTTCDTYALVEHLIFTLFWYGIAFGGSYVAYHLAKKRRSQSPS